MPRGDKKGEAGRAQRVSRRGPAGQPASNFDASIFATVGQLALPLVASQAEDSPRPPTRQPVSAFSPDVCPIAHTAIRLRARTQPDRTPAQIRPLHLQRKRPPGPQSQGTLSPSHSVEHGFAAVPSQLARLLRGGACRAPNSDCSMCEDSLGVCPRQTLAGTPRRGPAAQALPNVGWATTTATTLPLSPPLAPQAIAFRHP